MKNNDWSAVTVRCLRDDEEMVSALLVEFGSTGTATTFNAENCEVTGYFADDITAIVARLHDLQFDVSANYIEQSDWVNNWKQYYDPARVTRYLTIVPSWDSGYQPAPEELVIRLDPDTSFGTGTHPTTVLALYALQQILRGAESVIDVGTGSGVLAIAAALLGANSVLATDVDEAAVAIAQTNVLLNPISVGIEVISNDLLHGITQKFDTIVANILAEVLILLIDDAAQLLNPNGHLILSGIYHDKVELILTHIANAGLIVQTQMKQDDWHCVVAKKAV